MLSGRMLSTRGPSTPKRMRMSKSCSSKWLVANESSANAWTSYIESSSRPRHAWRELTGTGKKFSTHKYTSWKSCAMRQISLNRVSRVRRRPSHLSSNLSQTSSSHWTRPSKAVSMPHRPGRVEWRVRGQQLMAYHREILTTLRERWRSWRRYPREIARKDHRQSRTRNILACA